MLFKRRWPEDHITSHKLRKLYKKYMIRQKMLRYCKLPLESRDERIYDAAMILQRRVKYCTEAGFRIIMLDEMMVTKSTFPKVEWSLPNKPMCLDIG